MNYNQINDYLKSVIDQKDASFFTDYKYSPNYIGDHMCDLFVYNDMIQQLDKEGKVNIEKLITDHFDDFVRMLLARASLLNVKLNTTLSDEDINSLNTI